MKPLEKIVLHSIPLKSILEWLTKPKGPNLVEATMYGAPEKALVLAATKCTLYMEDPPSVGVGLVYKPHYVSTESFCRAYMHLNVWHAVASDKDSTDKLDSSRFILVSISETSEVMPDALLHPLFLDVMDKEAVEETGGPLAPRWFGVSGSILCGASHLGRNPSTRSFSLASEGIPLHPCWSMNQRSSLRACGRGLRWRYLSDLLPVDTGT